MSWIQFTLVLLVQHVFVVDYLRKHLWLSLFAEFDVLGLPCVREKPPERLKRPFWYVSRAVNWSKTVGEIHSHTAVAALSRLLGEGNPVTFLAGGSGGLPSVAGMIGVVSAWDTQWVIQKDLTSTVGQRWWSDVVRMKNGNICKIPTPTLATSIKHVVPYKMCAMAN